jgi:orotidine-5'-phosphate decarboxylase
MEAKERLIFPLDVANLAEARKWVRQLGALVGVFKVGLELFTAEGPSVLQMIREESKADIFLDLKLHDIPHTMRQAAHVASLHGADILTVHMLAGRQAVRGCVEAVEGGTKIFGVTVLTSHTRADLMEIGYAPELSRDLREAVLRLAGLAYRAGCHGVVCSAKEVTMVKEAFPHLRTIVPGIRPEWAADPQDQARIATPYEAILAGADYLVIGRPIREAPKPREAVKKILEEMERAFEERRR